MNLIKLSFPQLTPKTYTYISHETLDIGTIVMAELRNKIIPGVVIDYDQDVNFTVKPILSVTKYALKRSQIDWLLKAQEYNLSNLGELTKLCLMSKNYDETEITSFYEGESGEISSICYYLNRYGKRNFQKLLTCDELIQKKFSFNI